MDEDFGFSEEEPTVYRLLEEPTWSYAMDMLTREVDLLEEAASASASTVEFEDWLGNQGFERRDEANFVPWGVAAASAALSAAGLFPTDADPGSADDPNRPSCPVIVIAVGNRRAELLVRVLEGTDVSMRVVDGFAHLIAPSIVEFNLLANRVLDDRDEFDNLGAPL